MRSPNTIIRRLPLLLLGLLLVIHDRVDGFTTPVGVASTPATATAQSRNSREVAQWSAAPSATNEDKDEDEVESPVIVATNIQNQAGDGDDDDDDELSSSLEPSYRYESVFDFSDPSQEAVNKFDRIDDAIMGGISTSSIRPNKDETTGESFASWSGVCRTDGGGFCGTRTLPFRDGIPLRVVGDDGQQRDGFYLTVRLASDNEPEKRGWKLTTRVENVSRSEQLYQAMLEVPKQKESGEGNDKFGSEWCTIRVPFDDFVQVKGPRIVENGPPLDVTGGLFQIGMTMSKFRIAANATEFTDFRPGYFELQIQDIGVYTSVGTTAGVDVDVVVDPAVATKTIDTPMTLTKKEADQKRPTALKILFPIVKLFLNEKRSRRKSATRILKSRGYGRLEIARFGFRRRVSSKGMIVALVESLAESVSGLARFVAFWTLKIALFYPFRAIQRILKKLKPKEDSKKAKEVA